MNPAPKFRALRRKGDRKYLEAYVKFFKVEWL